MKCIVVLILFVFFFVNVVVFELFVVFDICIDGFSCIFVGMVYNYLLVNKGDQFIEDEVQCVICVFYNIKFFSDVQLICEGSILVIKVVECFLIVKFILCGNKDIKEEDLCKGLKEIGLFEGEIFDCLLLDCVKQELIIQYYNCGKYNVLVDLYVMWLDCNCVVLDIEICEGKVVKFKEINIVGNIKFIDKQIEDNFELGIINWMFWYLKNDQYLCEKFFGDLEKLQFYYMNCGYVDFGVDFIQVIIVLDKCEMYIVVSIKEGEIYKVFDVYLLGKLILFEEMLCKLVFVKIGDMFNCVVVEVIFDVIKGILVNIGFVYVKVILVLKLDKDKCMVDMIFYIELGQWVYVCCVIFQGNICIEDDVMCCQLCQFEGLWYLQVVIDCLKICLQQLGYFKKVDIDKQCVLGIDDKVDVMVKVEEQFVGSLQFGVGYLQYLGIILFVLVLQNNFLGIGDSFSVGVESSMYYKCVNVSYYNLYFIDSGVGIGYSLGYFKIDYGNIDFVNYVISVKLFLIYLGILIIEIDSLCVGLGLSSNKINLFDGYMLQVLLDYQNVLGYKIIYEWIGMLGWNYDICNGYWVLICGGLLLLFIDVVLLGFMVEYFCVSGEVNYYWLVGGGFVFYIDVQVQYGKIYGS